MPIDEVTLGAAALHQGGELRPDLRHERIRTGGAARHRAQRRAAVHRQVFRALSWRGRVHEADARTGARPGLRRNGVRDAACGCPTSTLAAVRAARLRNAPRSTRRCRAPRPTLIKLAMIAVQQLARRGAARHQTAAPGARRTRAGSTRRRAGPDQGRAAGIDERRRETRRAAGRRCGFRPELGSRRTEARGARGTAATRNGIRNNWLPARSRRSTAHGAADYRS